MRRLSHANDVTKQAHLVAHEDINIKQFSHKVIMAKNKQKGKKQKNVFQVANKQTKHKNKAKPVKTTLKHFNAVKNEKVENLNQIFTEVQRDVKSVSKGVAPKPKKPAQVKVVREPPKESVNVDSAAQLFSQL